MKRNTNKNSVDNLGCVRGSVVVLSLVVLNVSKDAESKNYIDLDHFTNNLEGFDHFEVTRGCERLCLKVKIANL